MVTDSKKKLKVSIALTRDVVKRLDRLARAQSRSRSSIVQSFVLDGLDGAEMFVKAFSDPTVSAAFVQAFGDRDVLRSMTSAMREQMTDDQMDLFSETLRGLSVEAGKKKKK